MTILTEKRRVDFMNTEITKERLTEWFYPTEKFVRYTDNAVVDYAEIEIKPDGIKKLEDNLDRCVGNPRDFSEKDWENLRNPNEDIYMSILSHMFTLMPERIILTSYLLKYLLLMMMLNLMLTSS